MRLFTVILLIVVGLVIVYVFWPAKFADGKDWVNDKLGLAKEKVNETINENNEHFEETTPDDNMTYTTNRSQPIILKNDCDYENYGLPNYDGTTKEGQGCDTAYQPDLTCIANPPKNYDGTIDKINQVSTPSMTCCLEDGTCQW